GRGERVLAYRLHPERGQRHRSRQRSLDHPLDDAHDQRRGHRTMTGRVKRRRGQAGFTMIELLISLLVASVITSSIYFVFRSQSRISNVKEPTAKVQADLRFPRETIKSDLKRAGSLGVLNPAPDNFYCGTRPNPPITALQHVDGAAVPVNSNLTSGSFVYNP